MPQNTFITEDFLLENEYARDLYHKYAKPAPIVDFHCHLPPEQVAQDHRFENMTQIWLAGDHYKWRLMRANGVPERYCTGDASDWEKFEKWAETVPNTLRNPAYHWTHLELRRPFGITNRLFGPDTARSIWEECNEKLAQPAFSARGIMKQMNVALVCTTDDPTDTLEAHRIVAEDPKFDVQMLPTWRPDKALAIESPEVFNDWVTRLEEAANMECATFEQLLEALYLRAKFFVSRGCKAADHGVEVPYAENYSLSEVRKVFNVLRAGKAPDAQKALQYKSAMLYELGILNYEMDWAQQLHIGPIRNNNTRMFKALGPDIGFDSVGDQPFARSLAKFLDRLDQTDQLTRTVLYTINPASNMVVATMAGNFQDGSVPGKIQFGSGWWFNDQIDGMRQQLETLSQVGLLSRFIGMLTDSRSFLSYPRHDYFRRLLCNVIGADMVKGLIPPSVEYIGRMIYDICYNNPAEYFRFSLPRTAGKKRRAKSKPTK
ncbi:MAG TPA: glucuronate isomerase [Candidatus Hydrogenedentes bacterium]|nr:glucuronate isomerase [Candidatus Hydrogenedentota bacterium]